MSLLGVIVVQSGGIGRSLEISLGIWKVLGKYLGSIRKVFRDEVLEAYC